MEVNYLKIFIYIDDQRLQKQGYKGFIYLFIYQSIYLFIIYAFLSII